MIKYKKYQTAGTLYVDDPKHPRLQAYQDSSNLYNNYKELIAALEKQNYSVEENLNSGSIYRWLEANKNKNNTIPDDIQKESGKLYSTSDFIRGVVNKTLPRQLFSYDIKPKSALWYGHPYSVFESLKGSLGFNDAYPERQGDKRLVAEYSNVKPIQPVEYRPKTVTNKKVTSTPKKRIIDPNIVAKQKLIGTTPDGIWGPKSEEAWKQYQNKNTTTPIQSTPAPVVNNPQIVNTPVQVVEPKSPSFKYTKYNGQTYDMSPSMEKEVDKAMYNRQSGGNLKYQVAGRTQLNKDFIEGISNSKPKKTINKPDLYNNPTEIDNTKVNYQQAPIIYKTYPQNVNGKTVNVPTNQGTITQGNPDNFKDTLYNRSKNSKTFNNLANNLIIPVTNIAGGLEGANLIKQGIKNIIKRIPKKVPLKVNDISNEIRLYNRNFNNNPTDNYKAIIDKGTNPIISKDIPDEPYERIFHRKYTHGNPDDMHKIIRVNNENINGFANSLSHINNEEDMEPLLKNIIKKYNKENHPNEKGGLNYKPDWLQSIMEKGKQRKPFAKRPNLNTQKSEMSFNFENMINNNHLSKIYKDLERRNIDISNINRIKNNLYKFDDIE